MFKLIFCNVISHFQSCCNCGGEIEKGEQVVVAGKLSEDVCFHPACFTCSTCEELLVDMTYCQHSRKLYCERHYAELIRPRCPACDEVSLQKLLPELLSFQHLLVKKKGYNNWSCQSRV